MDDTKLTPEETLDKVMKESPYNANFRLSKPYILKAIELYAQQQVKDTVD